MAMEADSPARDWDGKFELIRRRLAPADAVRMPPTRDHKTAAVLLPLIVRDGNLAMLYTRRNDRMKTHAGQVAFPGGRLDMSDLDLASAALRETYEEVGIHPAKIHMLGSFPGRRTMQSEIMVTPFVGAVRDGAEIKADPKEVAEIFYVPLAALRDRRYRQRFRPDGAARLGEQPAIIYDGYTIWGLTYYLTLSFLGLIADSGF
jgi:8-oxo-dGTP pyrophosphatase MutT (NUDIX family)